MNRLQKISLKLAQDDRPKPIRRRRRQHRPAEHGTWRKIIESLARHPDRYLP